MTYGILLKKPGASQKCKTKIKVNQKTFIEMIPVKLTAFNANSFDLHNLTHFQQKFSDLPYFFLHF